MSGKSYTIKYDVHCVLQNFWKKEMIIKNCMSEMHAKSKLDDYCSKKYGVEYQFIIVTSCVEKFDFNDSFENIFGKGFGNMSDLLKGKK
jgi:hypothetical protein